MPAPKLTPCAKCGVPKMRKDFVQGQGHYYPNCRECGNERKVRVYAPPEMRTCTCCGKEKVLYKEFNRRRKSNTYNEECIVCRRELGIANAERAAHARRQNAARADEKRNAHKVCAEPVKLSGFDAWLALGKDWSRPVYDPHNMKNRHEGART